jgi:X-Pro dipeptidyl-peptidase
MQHGWRDFNTKPDQFTRYWLALAGARDKRAIVGQWNHTDVFSSPPKGMPVDVRGYLDDFFARYLKGAAAPGLDGVPKVLSQGFDGKWRSSLPMTTAPTRFSFRGEPRSFVNTGTQTSKAFKDQPVGSDPATAAYVTAPLPAARRLAGGGTVSVDLALDGVRGQLDATLLDVAPDGSQRVVTLGLLDLRYNDSLAAPRNLVPGQKTRATVTLRPQDAVVAKGHRLALVLAGSEAVWGVPDTMTGQRYTIDSVSMRLPLVAP